MRKLHEVLKMDEKEMHEKMRKGELQIGSGRIDGNGVLWIPENCHVIKNKSGKKEKV